jgi:hypothetical protein
MCVGEFAIIRARHILFQVNATQGCQCVRSVKLYLVSQARPSDTFFALLNARDHNQSLSRRTCGLVCLLHICQHRIEYSYRSWRYLCLRVVPGRRIVIVLACRCVFGLGFFPE